MSDTQPSEPTTASVSEETPEVTEIAVTSPTGTLPADAPKPDIVESSEVGADDASSDSNIIVGDDGKIEIVGRRKTQKPFNVTLVGEQYRALPMKAFVAVDMAKKMGNIGDDTAKLEDMILNWMKAIFGRTQAPLIVERLKTPGDDLDLADIMDLIKALSQKATKNPTS
jgi:hypothetical protein